VSSGHSRRAHLIAGWTTPSALAVGGCARSHAHATSGSRSLAPAVGTVATIVVVKDRDQWRLVSFKADTTINTLPSPLPQ